MPDSGSFIHRKSAVISLSMHESHIISVALFYPLLKEIMIGASKESLSVGSVTSIANHFQIADYVDFQRFLSACPSSPSASDTTSSQLPPLSGDERKIASAATILSEGASSSVLASSLPTASGSDGSIDTTKVVHVDRFEEAPNSDAIAKSIEGEVLRTGSGPGTESILVDSVKIGDHNQLCFPQSGAQPPPKPEKKRSSFSNGGSGIQTTNIVTDCTDNQGQAASVVNDDVTMGSQIRESRPRAGDSHDHETIAILPVKESPTKSVRDSVTDEKIAVAEFKTSRQYDEIEEFEDLSPLLHVRIESTGKREVSADNDVTRQTEELPHHEIDNGVQPFDETDILHD
jgi:hypothetical protein